MESLPDCLDGHRRAGVNAELLRVIERQVVLSENACNPQSTGVEPVLQRLCSLCDQFLDGGGTTEFAGYIKQLGKIVNGPGSGFSVSLPLVEGHQDRFGLCQTSCFEGRGFDGRPTGVLRNTRDEEQLAPNGDLVAGSQQLPCDRHAVHQCRIPASQVLEADLRSVLEHAAMATGGHRAAQPTEPRKGSSPPIYLSYSLFLRIPPFNDRRRRITGGMLRAHAGARVGSGWQKPRAGIRSLPQNISLSRLRYWIASATWWSTMVSWPSRSARVRATRSTLS